jgi:hypothetical protein
MINVPLVAAPVWNSGWVAVQLNLNYYYHYYYYYYYSYYY